MYTSKPSFFPVCLKCNQYPLLKLSYEHPGQLEINCQCGYQDTLPLKDYLWKLNDNTHNEIKNLNCSQHGNNPYIYFCIICKKHLCDECQKGHNKYHQLITLKDKIDISKYKGRITEAHQHIDSYITQLKETYIQELNKQIEMIEKAFQDCLENNNVLLSFLQLLINSYSEKYPNYFLSRNLCSNSEINVMRYDNSSFISSDYNKYATEKLSDFLRNFSILKDNSVVNTSKFIDVQTIEAHDNAIYSLVLLEDGRIATCSGDKKIKVFNLTDYKCDMTLEGHTDTVTYISQLDNGKLISCSRDRSFKVWSIDKNTFKLDTTIEEAHNSILWKIIPISNKRIASCSFEGNIKIWNGEAPYSHIKTLEGHSSDVSSIIQIKDKEELVSASYDFTLILWNLSTYSKEKTVKGVKCRWSNSLLELPGHRVIVGGYNLLSVVNLSTGEIEQSVEDDQLEGICSMISLRDETVLCGCRKKLTEFDINHNTLVCINEEAHQNDISSLVVVNDSMFVSCSWDTTFKIWKY